MNNILKLSFNKSDERYIGWIDCGLTYGCDLSGNFRAIDQDKITISLDKSTSVQSVDKTDSPFRNWEFPQKVIEIEFEAHCNIFAMPVDKDVLLTAFGDNSLGHGIETSSNLKSAIQNSDNINVVLKERSPFRKHVSQA